MFPPEDSDFEEFEISSVDSYADEEGGWTVGIDGFGVAVPKDCPITPAVGMRMRLYGKGFGHTVRGMFIDATRVYYRTQAEDEEYQKIQLYGADAAEWLRRWDAGRIVWSISMGGLGPSYEQCIQITVAEILRVMLTKQYDSTKWSDEDNTWKREREEIDAEVGATFVVKALGLSGAQWHAAMELATHLYMHGPCAIMTDARVKNRHIQVQRFFPGAAAA